MNQFVLHLQSPSRYERIERVTSFVGCDDSGSFGIMPKHERMMTVLNPGIARFRQAAAEPEYLGLAEGLLYFVDDQLFISTHKYFRDRDYAHLSSTLLSELAKEEEGLANMKETIHHMEEALLTQLVRTAGARQQ